MSDRHSLNNILEQIYNAEFKNNFAVIDLKYNYSIEQLYYDLMDIEHNFKNIFKLKLVNESAAHISIWASHKLYIYEIKNNEMETDFKTIMERMMIQFSLN